MRVGERNARRSIVLGGGAFFALPPAFHAGEGNHSRQTLTWEGEVRLSRSAAAVGSFDAGLISVKVRLERRFMILSTEYGG